MRRVEGSAFLVSQHPPRDVRRITDTTDYFLKLIFSQQTRVERIESFPGSSWTPSEQSSRDAFLRLAIKQSLIEAD